MAASTEGAGRPRLPMQLPVLDGVRGLAILLVLPHHFAEAAVQSKVDTALHLLFVTGWVGVDLFFVLSGFLITRILLRARDGTRYFVSFYGRRVLRIFPLYYATLLVLLVVVPALSDHWRETVSSRASPYFWVYLQNVAFWAPYFPVRGLGHLWSLAIEEQFYLVWPLLVWLLPRRLLAGICVASFPLAMAVRGYLHHQGADLMGVYAFTPARIDTLLLGALLAIVAESRGFTAAAARWSWMGVVLFGAALLPVAVHDTSLFNYGAWTQRFGFELVALLWGSFLVATVTAPPTSLVCRAFGSAPMRTLGKYSYGMYVFHLPLRDFVFEPLHVETQVRRALGVVPGTFAYLAFAIAVTFAAAYLSYEHFEARFLELKRFFEYGPRAERGEAKLAASVAGSRGSRAPERTGVG